MSKCLDLIGQKFGKLTVISRAGSNKNGRSQWNCRCKCGNECIIIGQYLVNGETKSCGCLQPGVNIKEIYGRLTIISFSHIFNNRKYYQCKCDCGKECIVLGKSLVNGDTKSCGCLQTRRALINVIKNTKYSPSEASARSIWKKYADADITFEVFYYLSQLPCHYCGNIKINSYNMFKKSNNHLSQETGFFKYNGLDRINSNLNHQIDNCLPCCKFCNIAKLNFSYHDFLQWAKKVYYNFPKTEFNINKININNINIINKYKLGTAKAIWRRNYSNLDFNIFDNLSQINCFYCNALPSNKYNRYIKNCLPRAKTEGIFIYNGIDRLNSTLGYTLDNIVPCCFKCNSAKNTKTIKEFKNWVEQLYTNIVNKSLFIIPVENFIKTYQKGKNASCSS